MLWKWKGLIGIFQFNYNNSTITNTPSISVLIFESIICNGLSNIKRHLKSFSNSSRLACGLLTYSILSSYSNESESN